MGTPFTIVREPLQALLASGLESMLTAHWDEVAVDKDAIRLNPDWQRYFNLEASGAYIAYGARIGGELVGYTSFFVSRGLHYRDHLFALNDVIYMRPAHRGIDGLVLVLWAEKALEKMGVTKVVYHTKTEAFLGESEDSLGALEQLMDLEEEYGVKMPDNMPVGDGTTLGEVLVGLGYRHFENEYGKLLGGSR